MNEFEELMDRNFTSDEVVVIESAARFDKWYVMADNALTSLISLLDQNGIPAAVIVDVLEENAAWIREIIQEDDDND